MARIIALGNSWYNGVTPNFGYDFELIKRKNLYGKYVWVLRIEYLCLSMEFKTYREAMKVLKTEF